LIEQAERVVGGEDETEETEGDEEVEDMDEEMIEDVEDKMEAGEEEQDPPEQPQEQPEPEPVEPTLSQIQKACLAFCIALLNQSVTRKEYDNPLVCALAVLGVKENG
jgi:hypothetical protein